MNFVQPLSDEEYLSLKSNKAIYADILLGIYRLIPIKEKYNELRIEEELRVKLKFKHLDDHLLLRACIDLLEDTENAISNFEEKGLGTGKGTGEQYIRLYGILNAIYQQISVILEFVELFNYPGKSEHTNKLKNLPIYHLRNKLAAHTINHQEARGKAMRENRKFYRVALTTITQWGDNMLILPQKGTSENVNLCELIREYQLTTDELLEGVCDKAINSIYQNDSKAKSWLLFRLDFVRNRREQHK